MLSKHKKDLASRLDLTYLLMLTRSAEVLANTLDISIFLIGTILAKCK